MRKGKNKELLSNLYVFTYGYLVTGTLFALHQMNAASQEIQNQNVMSSKSEQIISVAKKGLPDLLFWPRHIYKASQLLSKNNLQEIKSRTKTTLYGSESKNKAQVASSNEALKPPR